MNAPSEPFQGVFVPQMDLLLYGNTNVKKVQDQSVTREDL